MSEALADLKPLAERHHRIQAAAAGPSSEKTVLLMSYHDVDQRELARLIEDFRRRLNELGVELSVENSRNG